jgi:hypothetical protein
MATSPLYETILLIGTASGVFAGNPFFHEQDFFPGNVERIRWGELSGSAITIAMGWALAHKDRNVKPLIASVIISLIFTAGYEFMIQHSCDTGAKSTRDI